MSERHSGMDHLIERGVKADRLHTITQFTREAATHNSVIAAREHLTPIEESSSPETLYHDAIYRYTRLGQETAGNATPASQRTMRNLRGRIDELLPAIAKHEIATQLASMPKETYQRTLEARRKEIEAFDEKEGYDDTAPELVERDLINEKLKQLATWETAKGSPTVAERKQRMRSIKARITVLTNDMEKKTRQMHESWNPLTRWQLSTKLIELREKREIAQAMLGILRDAGEIPHRKTTVHVNNGISENDLEAIAEDEALAAK